MYLRVVEVYSRAYNTMNRAVYALQYYLCEIKVEFRRAYDRAFTFFCSKTIELCVAVVHKTSVRIMIRNMTGRRSFSEKTAHIIIRARRLVL